MSRKSQHRCHGDPERFEVVAQFISETYANRVHYIADVAGGQGLLSRLLHKHFNYHAEVIDPRGHTLTGVPSRAETFEPQMAQYYDLVVGLHPDEATRAVAGAALFRPTVMVPCCNFWAEEKLGRDELVDAIADWYEQRGIRYQRVVFGFNGPKNVGLVTTPPEANKR